MMSPFRLIFGSSPVGRSVGLVLVLTVFGLPRLLADDSVASTSPASASPPMLAIGDQDLARLRKYETSQVISAENVTIKVDGRVILMKLLGVETTRNESRDFLKELLAGQAVCLEYDPNPGNQKDSAGHPVAYVYRADDGLFINHALVAHGYSGLSANLGPRAEQMREAYRLARINGFGLWTQGKIYLSPSPSLGFLEGVAGTRRRRAEYKRALRDYQEGVVAAYFEGRREAAFQRGSESIRYDSSSGHAGGYSKVSVRNGMEAQLKVHLVSENFSRDLIVSAKSLRAFAVPFGQYEVSYQLDGDPGGPVKGEPFTLSGDPVEIQIAPQAKKDGDPKPTGGAEPTAQSKGQFH